MRVLILVTCLALVAGCHQEPEAESGSVPTPAAEVGYFPRGDANAGFGVFERMGCSACHLVAGYDVWETHLPRPKVLTLPRPGVTPRTDQELFIAIVDPGHQLDPKVAESARGPGGPMPTYRDIMTVQQLLDVIAFLREAEAPRR